MISNWAGGSAVAVGGIFSNAGTNSGDAYSMCLNVNNNTVAGTGQNAGGGDYLLFSRFGVLTRMPGYTGALTDMAAVGTYLAGRTNGASTTSTLTGGGGGFGNTSPAGSACPTP